LIGISLLYRDNMFRQVLQFSFQGLGLLLLVPAIQFPRYVFFRKLLESRILVFIGHISYSLYLFHWGASKLANHWFDEFSVQWQLLFWLLTILLSLFSYFCVEKPFIGLRRRFGSGAVD
jgi:peptidoglycan/LPS O-acetylase OafA/YrhL